MSTRDRQFLPWPAPLLSPDLWKKFDHNCKYFKKCLTTINLIAINFLISPKTYKDLPEEAYLANFGCMGVVAFALIYAYLITKSEFKRAPLPEERPLVNHTDN